MTELFLLLIGIALAVFAGSFLILSMIRLGRESERIANEIKNEKTDE